jgi:putative nucleotidyltransferase with HDIG domain
MSMSFEGSRLDRWRRRLDAALERLRERAGWTPEELLRERATARAAARLRVHAWPAGALDALARLRERGARAYLVGGTVRDVLLDRRGDATLDVATSLTPDEVTARFTRVAPIGVAHGTVLVVEPGFALECTTFRREGGYADARHPDHVTFTDDPLADLARRDFTVNAMAFDPASGELLDPHGGARDLERATLRAVGDAAARFHEDALRPLRAARFAATLEFELEPATAAALGSANDRARLVAMERVREEWVRMMRAVAPSTGIELLRRAGLLATWMPELDRCAGVGQNRYHAYDVYEHSLRTCDAAPADRPRVRWAALLHDIGKPETRVIRNGDATFYGHAERSAELADAVLERFRFATEERRAIVHLVLHHMFDFRREWTDAALRRWLRRVGVDAVAELFDLRIADVLGNGLATGYPVMLEELRRRIERLLAAEHAITVRDLSIDGRDVMDALGIEPGPRVGAVLEQLLERVLDDPAHNRREALLRDLEDMRRRRSDAAREA